MFLLLSLHGRTINLKPATMTFFHKRIKASLAAQGLPVWEPRHIEAYMRLNFSTLINPLSQQQFDDEVLICSECIKLEGPAKAESLAQSIL